MSELTINTTQNVTISFTAASIGERILAYVIDLIIKTAYVIVVCLFFFYWLDLGSAMRSLDQWSRTAIVIMLFSPVFVYSIVLESIFEGQTIGKMLRKIKVVKIDGYQASLGDYMIRWFFRIIDVSISSGIIGLITIVSSEKSQRLGDMTAGTAVISLKNSISIDSTILEDIGVEYVPTYPLVIKLTDNDVRIIKENFLLATDKNDVEIITRLRKKIESVTGIVNQTRSEAAFVRTVLKDYNFYTQNM